MKPEKEPSMDEVFLDKLTSTVLENLENEQFGVEELSDQVGISRSHLHRKLKLLKGKSVSQFIREVRLEEAMKLLRRNVATTSEIAYRVGFNSPGYFHRCFRSHYGYSPGDVKKGPLEDEVSKLSENIDQIGKDEKSGQRKTKQKRMITALIVALIGVSVFLWYNSSKDQDSSHAIAVLPIHNFTGDSEQDYFVFGFHDALIGALGQISSLRVISRTSTMRYNTNELPSVQEIARELGVDVIVEGSVIGSGDNIYIQLQLIDVFPEERHIWTQEYEQDISNIIILQNEIAKSIANEIQISLTPSEENLLTSTKEVDPEAYKAYMKGRFHWDKLTKSDLDLAQQYFELAKEIDPDYALAYSGISLVWLGRLQQGLTSYSEGASKMKIGALKALSMDSTLSEVHFVLGGIYCWGDWKYKEAEISLRKAIVLNPNNSSAHAYLSHVLNIRNKSEEGMKHIKLALKLDPFNLLYQSLYGMCMMHTRQFDQAIDSLSLTLRKDPKNPIALSTLRTAYHMKGDYEKALRTWETSYAAREDKEAVRVLIAGKQEGGYQGALENLAELLVARSDTMYVTPWQIGTIYTRAGNKKEAIKWLERAYNAHDNNMPYLGVDPIFDVLKDEPRFEELLEKMGL